MAAGVSLRHKSNPETHSLENSATKLCSSSSHQGKREHGRNLFVTVGQETEQLTMPEMVRRGVVGIECPKKNQPSQCYDIKNSSRERYGLMI